MARKCLPFFDQHSEPLEQRIATGLHKLGLAMKQQAWLRANEDGLSPTQAQILAALAAGGAQTGTELSRQLGVTLPTVSDSVRVLVEKALVAKKPDPRHPRASLIELTAAGKRQAARAESWPEFLATAVGSMSDVEQTAFHSGLVKMIRTLQENGQIPTLKMCVTCKYFQPNVHGGSTPHHCGFVDAPMANSHLRLECDDHEEAAPQVREATWQQFLHPG